MSHKTYASKIHATAAPTNSLLTRRATSEPAPQAPAPKAAEEFDGRGRSANPRGHSLGRFKMSPVGLRPSGSGRELPEPLRRKMESAFGRDFSGVRVHTSGHPASIGAEAYTRGQDIHFAPGQYQPASRSGQKLIGHELTHVVQQQQGRVKSTVQMKGLPVNYDTSLETEADAMGERASGVGHASVKQALSVSHESGSYISNPSPVYQCQWRRLIRPAAHIGGMFVAHNAYEQYRHRTNPNLNPGGGRLGAVMATANYPQGSVGAAAHLPVSVAHLLTGNLFSATIGQHYREPDVARRLSSEDTDENVADFANHETNHYWGRQTGMAGVIGRGLSAQRRTSMLIGSRNFQRWLRGPRRDDE